MQNARIGSRILVIGCPGAGKSTFSRKLRARTGLPLIYLDMLFHNPDRTTVSNEEFDAKLWAALEKPRWIIDGNYIRTLEMRLEEADTVFLFDLPTEVCLAGARSRIGKPRPDMPWQEKSIDPAFEEWIRTFREIRMPRVYELLEKHAAGRSIYRFGTREAADEFLARSFPGFAEMPPLFDMIPEAEDPTLPAFVRPSARAILIENGRVLMVKSEKYGFYKFPGGGIERGETAVAALIREAAEEAGILLAPESIRPYGAVRRIDDGSRSLFFQENFYYFAKAAGSCPRDPDPYETEEGFTPLWTDPAPAIEANLYHVVRPKDARMLERDARVLQRLIEEGYLPK